MTVAFDAKGTADLYTAAPGGANIDFTNLTIGSIQNGVVVALVTYVATTSQTFTVTWDQGGTNLALTKIGEKEVGADTRWATLWGAVGPVSGNKTLRVTTTAGMSQVTVDAISFSGASQVGGTTTFANLNSATATGATASVTITSNSNDMVVANMVAAVGTATWSSVNNNQIYIENTSVNAPAAGNYASGAASVTMQGTLSNASWAWAILGVDIAATSPPPPLASAELPPRAAQRSVDLLAWLQRSSALSPLPKTLSAQLTDLPPRGPDRSRDDVYAQAFRLRALSPLPKTLPTQLTELSPRGPQRAIDLLTHVLRLRALSPYPASTLPGGRLYELAPRGPDRAREDVYTQALRLNALAPLPKTLPAQFTELPPRAPDRARDDVYTQALRLRALAPRPFAQSDWPNPPPGPARARDDVYAVASRLNALAPTPRASASIELPPRAAAAPIIDWIAGANALLLTPAVAPARPLLPIDWPNPRGPTPLVIDWRRGLDALVMTLEGSALPCGASSFPQPAAMRGAPRASPDWFAFALNPPATAPSAHRSSGARRLLLSYYEAVMRHIEASAAPIEKRIARTEPIEAPHVPYLDPRIAALREEINAELLRIATLPMQGELGTQRVASPPLLTPFPVIHLSKLAMLREFSRADAALAREALNAMREDDEAALLLLSAY